MSFDWTQFLNIADHLYRNPINSDLYEANYRTVIGRAYYASYWTVRKYLVDVYGATINKNSAHSDVINSLNNLGHKARNIREDLKSLLDYRKIADYEDEIVIRFDDTAIESIELANDIIDNVRKLQR